MLRLIALAGAVSTAGLSGCGGGDAGGATGGPLVFRGEPGPLYTVEADGSVARRLTDMEASAPGWSPDGSRIVFTAGEEDKSHVYTIGADGKGLEQLTVNGNYPSWSPDGNHLALQIDGDIQIASLADGSVTKVTSNPEPDREYDESPQYSADGKRLVFLRIRNGDPELSAVWVVNVDGTDEHEVTRYRMRAGHPWWSPDGTRIVFNDGKGTVQPESGNSHIFVVNPDGSDLEQLTKDDGAADFHPSWSPDGKTILFTRYRFSPDSTPFALYRMDPDGSHVALLYSSPDGDVNDVSMAPKD